MQSGGAASVSDRWQTPSRIVFPHQLLNYSGQGFLWGDPGSSRQTDAVGPAGGLAGKLGIDAKNSQQPWLVLLVAAVKTGQFTGSIANKRGGDLAEPGGRRDRRGAAVPGGASCKINGRTWQFSHRSHLLLRRLQMQQHVGFGEKRGGVTLRLTRQQGNVRLRASGFLGG